MCVINIVTVYKDLFKITKKIYPKQNKITKRKYNAL